MDVLYYTEDELGLCPRIWRVLLLIGLTFIVTAGTIYLLFGQVATLECERQIEARPSCIVSRSLAGFTYKEQAISGLIDAWVDASTDSDDDPIYRVVLETDQGSIPLTTFYSSGRQMKIQAATSIDSYLVNREQKVYSLQYGGNSLLMPIIFGIIGCILSILSFTARKTMWQFSRYENRLTHIRSGLFKTRVTEYAFNEITGAEVTSSRDSDGDRTYRIELNTTSGQRIPMTSWYSSGEKKKRETADLIRKFISGVGAVGID
ncbi:MAG: hypothetical protein P1S60_18405 [Anaerolineae bacterium]|nr:hypothetical protein [Anaerolineae bacterium]